VRPKTIIPEIKAVQREQEFYPALSELRFQTDIPSAFGITLTPELSGALFAVLGIGGGICLSLNQLMPAWSNHQLLAASLAQKQTQVKRIQVGLQRTHTLKTALAQAKNQQREVLAMFANQKSLNTLLLDLNRIVESANALVKQHQARAQLQRFVPGNQADEAQADGSLGARVNGRLKRRVFNIAFAGTFEQTESILRNIERMQPLLTIKDYQSTLAPTPPTDASYQVVRGAPALINTFFQLQAIMPVSSEESARAAKAAKK